MPTVGSLKPHTKLADGKSDIVGDDADIGNGCLVELQYIAHGPSRVIHVRRRLDQDNVFTHALSLCEIERALPRFPAGRILYLLFERINDGKADIVARAVIGGAGIAEADKYFHDLQFLTQSRRSAVAGSRSATQRLQNLSALK